MAQLNSSFAQGRGESTHLATVAADASWTGKADVGCFKAEAS